MALRLNHCSKMLRSITSRQHRPRVHLIALKLPTVIGWWLDRRPALPMGNKVDGPASAVDTITGDGDYGR